MGKNLQYVLVVIIVLAILYLLYKNSSESYNSCTQQPEKSNETSNIKNIHEQSEHMTTKSNKTLVVHHTTWCGYSKRFLQQLELGLRDKLKKVGVNVELVDCQEEPEKCVGIKGYPTLVLYSDKGKTVYQGDRSDEHLTAFCLQH